MLKQYIGISRDHSGSMYPIANAAKNDYNAQIDTIRKASTDFNIQTNVTTVTCGGYARYETINQDISRINFLNSYYATGGTPLFDSVKMLIDELKRWDDGSPNTSFLIQVITDGEENTSRITSTQLASEIRRLQETDRWTFTFRVPRGYKNALQRRLNVPEGNIIEWETTEQGMATATVATTQAYNDYYTARTKGLTSTRGFYSDLSNLKSSDVKKNLNNITQELNIYSVDKDDEQISKFFERKTKMPYPKGQVFYELTKYERAIQESKKIIIQDMKQGGFYTGPVARKMLGLPEYGSTPISPGDHAHYKIYVQSTSLNRKLKKGTSVVHWQNVR